MATVKQLNETTYEVTVIKSGEEFKHFKEHILTHFTKIVIILIHTLY